MTERLDAEKIGQITQFFKLLGDKTRLSIVLLVKEKEMNVSEISEALDMEQSAVSHQLATLKKARLVKGRREKRSIYYSPDDDHVYQILDQVIEHIVEEEHQHHD